MLTKNWVACRRSASSTVSQTRPGWGPSAPRSMASCSGCTSPGVLAVRAALSCRPGYEAAARGQRGTAALPGECGSRRLRRGAFYMGLPKPAHTRAPRHPAHAPVADCVADRVRDRHHQPGPTAGAAVVLRRAGIPPLQAWLPRTSPLPLAAVPGPASTRGPAQGSVALSLPNKSYQSS